MEVYLKRLRSICLMIIYVGKYETAWDSTGGIFARTDINLDTKSFQGLTLYRVNSVSGY